MPDKNYFELYELPLSFRVDDAQLKKKFYELSKRFHPDFYVNEPDEKQKEMLELSTLNNKAFQVLSDPLNRIEYILTLNDLMAEGDKYVLPQDFLMDMMDVNEALMEMGFEPDAGRLMALSLQIDQIEMSLFDELKKYTDEFDEGSSIEAENVLLKVKDIWYRQKYLMRIRESLNKIHV